MRNDYLKEYCCQVPFSSLFLHPSNRTPTQPQARDLGVTDTQLFLILPEPHPTTLSFPFLLEPTSYAGGPLSSSVLRSSISGPCSQGPSGSRGSSFGRIARRSVVPNATSQRPCHSSRFSHRGDILSSRFVTRRVGTVH